DGCMVEVGPMFGNRKLGLSQRIPVHVEPSGAGSIRPARLTVRGPIDHPRGSDPSGAQNRESLDQSRSEGRQIVLAMGRRQTDPEAGGPLRDRRLSDRRNVESALSEMFGKS